MKLRKSRPSISVSIGRMIVHNIPRRPDASPEKKTVTASTHSSPVMADLPSTVVGHARTAAGAVDGLSRPADVPVRGRQQPVDETARVGRPSAQPAG